MNKYSIKETSESKYSKQRYITSKYFTGLNEEETKSKLLIFTCPMTSINQRHLHAHRLTRYAIQMYSKGQ